MKSENISTRDLKKLLRDKLDRLYQIDPKSATVEQLYTALCTVIKEILENKLRRHDARTYGEGQKQVYYLSMEFLVGRSLKNNLYNLGLQDEAKAALSDSGVTLDMLYEVEPDAGLGNGGLGRLAACYMDGIATDGYSGTGYSIMYEYGIFKQEIIDGWQKELADNWLPRGDVWIDERRDEAVEVRFDGTLRESWPDGYHHVEHTGYNTVLAVPCDMYISGYDSPSVALLRLWRAKAPGIDMESFNKGDYAAALRNNGTAELISKVLYPNDNHIEGKILRLRQQYFLCCASVSDIVKNHLAQYGTLENLAEKVAVQLNDTHPTLAIPELMRVLLDDCGFSWQDAVRAAQGTFAYTNHTVMSEALEKWNADMFKAVLPRIYQIILEIDKMLREELSARFGGDAQKISAMSIFENGVIRMANLCVYMTHSVNGVSELHSEIIRQEVFSDYFKFEPEKFTNVTNGIAYRRWLQQSNPGLTGLLCETIGQGFLKDAAALRNFARHAGDAAVLQGLAQIKRANKICLIGRYGADFSHPINPDSVFDVQAKRMHEYKRQHLNAMHIIKQYLDLKENPGMDFVPRTYLFGAKAAPGYYLAKQMIRLIWGLQEMLERDEQLRDKLRVVYLEDYRVTVSETLMPAAEVSEQISLAGTEASGTGNMKLMLNGALTVGTLDGANVEIREAAGGDNFFLFGMTREQVSEVQRGYSAEKLYHADPEIRRVVDFIAGGFDGNSYTDLAENLMRQDPYLVLADFGDYCRVQREVDTCYRTPEKWNRMSVMNIAGAGVFSADRSVRDYADNIWKLKPVK